MAQFIKTNADLMGVLNFDSGSYVNDSVAFSGIYIAANQIDVINPSTTGFVPGQVVTALPVVSNLGNTFEVPPGVTVVSYAGGVLTVTPAVLSVPGPTEVVPLAVMSAGTKWVVGQTVQPQGPKLDFWTLTITAGCPMEAMQAVQQRGTIHMYKIASSTSLHVAVYDTAGWTDTALVAESNGFISAAVAGATFGA